MAASAAPGTVDETARKPSRKPYRSEDAALLSDIPNDWDNKLHTGLRRNDFVVEKAYLHFEWMANQAQTRADSLRAKAVEWKANGGLNAQKKENQFKALVAKLASLSGELSGSGIDVEALKAQVEAEMN